MSGSELIKQVAALPQQERTLFEQLFQAMKNGASVDDSAQRSNWPDFDKRLHSIYGDKIVADSQNVIDEGRGNL